MSSFELSRGYMKPVVGSSVHKITKDIANTQKRFKPPRFALSKKSESTSEIQIYVFEKVDVYSQNGMDTMHKLYVLKIVLLVEHDAPPVTIPDKGGRRVTVAMEDVW